jgi:3-hydroxyisobutyrate dehydrogenase-like beta-hydroxyacid dehydrogenase
MTLAANASRPAQMAADAKPRRPGNTAPVKRRVGIVGLGHMGTAFAANFVADGHNVLAWDRDPQHVAAHLPTGAEGATRLTELAACDVIVSSVTDDDALKSVVLAAGGLADILAPGAVHISMSTVSPALSQHLAEVHARHGQDYVAAPVLGNPDAVKARKLFVLVAGNAAAVERVRPLLEHLGQRVFVIGEDVAAANLVKLASNVLTAMTLESMGEVLALLRKGGIDPHVGFDVLTNSMFDSRVHRVYGEKIIDEAYSPPGMAVPLAVKDVRLALAEAERHAVPMPAASLVHDRLVGMLARGWADLDWSALGLLAARDAGLDDTMPVNGGGERPARA